MSIDISIIIPTYNEEQTLKELLGEIRFSMDDTGLSYAIICVDDGSQDNTWQIIQNEQQAYPEILKGIQLSRNFGKDAAIFAGLQHSDSNAVITMDADGQHPPKHLSEFIACWKDTGANVVNGVKSSRKADSILQRYMAILFNKLMGKIAKLDFIDASDYKLLDKKPSKRCYLVAIKVFFTVPWLHG